MTPTTAQWFDSSRWTVAHRMANGDGRPEEFLGETYWTTLCGKRVNAARVSPIDGEPAYGCETCERKP